MVGRQLHNKLNAMFRLPQALRQTPAVAFVPAGTLAAYWGVGEIGLLGAALALPASCWVANHIDPPKPRHTSQPMNSGLQQPEALEIELDVAMQRHTNGDLNAACYVVEIDEFDTMKRKHGAACGQALLDAIGQRLCHNLRAGDVIARISPSAIGICITSMRRFDTQSAFDIAARIKRAVEQMTRVSGVEVEICCSIGFCLASRAPIDTGKGMLDAALRAASEAGRQGNGAIRDYTNAMGGVILHPELTKDVAAAFEKGEIIAYFQPQICARTRRITGLEALARWKHPTHGIVAPLEFLNAVRQAGMWDSLTDQMIDQSLKTIVAADKRGFQVPQIGVNFAQDDLENSRIVDRVAWALDKYDLAPKRLGIEVLESVLSTATDDAAAQNIAGLRALGCEIDLDDFGTGHAAISTLRQIPARRIKVDRSFVIKIDQDEEQQQMMATILMMADRMGLDTLAEGIENEAELTILRDLGCNHIQGYGVGKPMPVDALFDWLANYKPESRNNVAIIANSTAEPCYLPQIGQESA